MRRRRQVLSVSTFPFLAVLLCAMGSLILLLLVIDRRAKVVMRAKALEAVRQMESADQKETAARAAEWEKRRRALHEQLQQQKQELEGQSASLERKLTDTSHDLQAEQAQTPVLEKKLQVEQENWLQGQKGIASRVQEANQQMQQSKATQSELARLTAELVKLEQALDDLKALRQRQQQTYSLVPYRGRRGDNRRPIYLECAADSLVFHPDRLTRVAMDSNGSAILQEVERRIRSQPSTRGAESSKKETPYLLLLVRPNGIMTYYRTLAALRNLQVDFGYEFVESDWILDFPADDKPAMSQPWMAAGPGPSPSAGRESPESNREMPERPTARREIAGTASGASYRPGDSASGRSYHPGSRSGPSPGTSEPSGKTNAKAGYGTSPMSENGAFQGRSGVTLGTTGPRGVSFAGTSNSDGTDQSGGPSYGGSIGSAPTGPPMSNSSQLPSSNQGTNRGDNSPGSPAGANGALSGPPAADLFSRDPIGERSSPMPGNALSTPFTRNDPATPRGSADSNLTSEKFGPGMGGIPNRTSPANATGAQSSPSLIPSDNAMTADSPRPPGNLSGSAGQASPPETEDAPSHLSGSSGLSQIGAPRQKKSEPLPAVRRYVRREWNIFVECLADQIIVYPGGLRIPAAELGDQGKTPDGLLLQAVLQMTARRQAVIASLEMPKDAPASIPHIRFLLRPDGLRTYFLAYPELESLHLPMTRENLDADEDVVRHMMGR